MMGFLPFAEVAQLEQFLPDPVRRIETREPTEVFMAGSVG